MRLLIVKLLVCFELVDRMWNSQMNKRTDEEDEEDIKPPKIDFRSLKPVSRGLGIRITQSDHEKRAREQEEKAYAPFSKRVKNEEENLKYIQEHHETNKNEFASSSQFENVKMDTDECDQETLSLYESLLNPNYNEELPIFKIKEQLKSILITNNVLIVQGNTGCGKTTQVPQMILDYHAEIKRKCKIIVTQPRRLAAVSICKRVCEERQWQVGSVCGYKIALDKRCSDITKIIYATTGYLLKEITSNISTLEEYTHIILDEVTWQS
jgi:ATP-dependent RNA helicase TDRD9